jgi:hypothetical protein
MEKVTEYLRFSTECRDLANKAPTAEIRNHYLNLADMWKSLADERRLNLTNRTSGMS